MTPPDRTMRPLTVVIGRGQEGLRQPDPGALDEADEGRRPARGHGARGHEVLEHEVPADDPGDDLAEGDVGVGIGAPGDGEHAGQLRIGQGAETARDRGDDERQQDAGAGELGALAGGHEDARPDDGSDAQGRQVDGPQVLLELGVLRGLFDLGRGFRLPDVHALPLLGALRRGIILKPGRKATPGFASRPRNFQFDNGGPFRIPKELDLCDRGGVHEDPPAFNCLADRLCGRRPDLLFGKRHVPGPGFDQGGGHDISHEVPRIAGVPWEEHPLLRARHRLAVYRPRCRADRPQALDAWRLLLPGGPGRGHDCAAVRLPTRPLHGLGRTDILLPVGRDRRAVVRAGEGLGRDRLRGLRAQRPRARLGRPRSGRRQRQSRRHPGRDASRGAPSPTG